MTPHWLLRMRRWAQNPPAPRNVRLVLLLLAFIAALYLVERVWGWPDWLTPDRTGRIPR
ncbi:hypothetical protein OCGS_2324 [Oceaniovalibus guishaninsula JLT2003]|uniref:Uncharacterized protein n=1 Tax=Oceaniovalibus guishaninsula JLT2003 TaxID=1231392 RepID=K2HAD1_9RHOB|nr:hypothetical protein [Oceaniovalibus guishaninsula]EKE43592.1 hypothetical protein OCGS_2324 [Oceaniovalibus guishaninsula JLT2003]